MGERKEWPSLFDAGQKSSKKADMGIVESELMYIQKTKNGHTFDVATSSFQKALRRGHETSALYWGHELWGLFPAYFWRRLLVISSEDLSADPMTSVILGQLATNAFLSSKGFAKKATGLIEAQATIIAARAPKSREACDAHGALTRAKENGWKLSPPDYALDMHTREGKRMARSFRQFGEEGRRVAGTPAERNDWEMTRWGFRADPVTDPDVVMPHVENALEERKPGDGLPDFHMIPDVE